MKIAIEFMKGNLGESSPQKEYSKVTRSGATIIAEIEATASICSNRNGC